MNQNKHRTAAEAREYVESGLQQRSIARQEREREEMLNDFEAEMISFCNKHSADSKKDRTKLETKVSYISARAAKQAEMEKKDEAAEKACKTYGYIFIAIMFLWTCTPLPFYGAVSLIAGLAVFPIIYIAKLYNLLDVKTK